MIHMLINSTYCVNVPACRSASSCLSVLETLHVYQNTLGSQHVASTADCSALCLPVVVVVVVVVVVQVEEQLREEDFIERCFEELWEEEEERESFIPSRDLPHLQGIQSELPLLQGIQSDIHKDADYPVSSGTAGQSSILLPQL